MRYNKHMTLTHEEKIEKSANLVIDWIWEQIADSQSGGPVSIAIDSVHEGDFDNLSEEECETLNASLSDEIWRTVAEGIAESFAY